MGRNRHELEDRSLAERVLKDGTNLDRRNLFVSAAAFGALASTTAFAQAPARSRCSLPSGSTGRACAQNPDQG